VIGGRAYPISTDFRTAVAFEMASLAGTLTERQFLDLWFPREQPEDLREALAAVGRFYDPDREDRQEEPCPPLYSFSRDAAAIYAAFRREYGIDLSREGLHWWHFRALLEGLITHSFRERVGYRAAELKGRSARERAEILKYRRLYALSPPETLAEHLEKLGVGREELGVRS